MSLRLTEEEYGDLMRRRTFQDTQDEKQEGDCASGVQASTHDNRTTEGN